MLQLFKSEFLRYRNWALGFSLIHLSYWAFINTVSPNLQISPRLMALNQQSTLTAVVTIGIGFLFGALQMGLHKRVNHWTYLNPPASGPGNYLFQFGYSRTGSAIRSLLRTVVCHGHCFRLVFPNRGGVAPLSA